LLDSSSQFGATGFKEDHLACGGGSKSCEAINLGKNRKSHMRLPVGD